MCTLSTRIGKNKLIAVLAMSIVASATIAGAPHKGAQPKLVVGIMVEDLQSEYVDLLREHFVGGGFNLLLNNGVVIPSMEYGTSLDATAATAVIFTGASPSVNGIPADEVFDRQTMRGVSVLNDPTAMGNYTTQTFSPASLAVTTISDESRVSASGINFVYSIATDPEQALIMAGHAGNCGIWLNDANTNWATTTFYKDPPPTLISRNRLNPLSLRIDTMSWVPLMGKDAYSTLPEIVTSYPFKHTFGKLGEGQKMRAFRTSPLANAEVTSFAIDNICTLKLGHHRAPDMISIAYTLEPYGWGRTADSRYETIDAYYRLDRNLSELFSAIDNSVGLDNTIIFLAGTPPAQRVRREDERWNLPYGEFSTRKAISLVNLYLIAKFGNGDWVQAYHNGQFFLNHKLVEEKKLDLETIRTETARFLEKMSGVTRAYTLEEILDARTHETAAINDNMAVALAGDVVLQVHPGWQIVDDFTTHERTEKVERAAASTAPAYIMAPGVEARTIDTPVDARSIAPTVTRLLRIRSPNGAALPALSL